MRINTYSLECSSWRETSGGEIGKFQHFILDEKQRHFFSVETSSDGLTEFLKAPLADRISSWSHPQSQLPPSWSSINRWTIQWFDIRYTRKIRWKFQKRWSVQFSWNLSFFMRFATLFTLEFLCWISCALFIDPLLSLRRDLRFRYLSKIFQNIREQFLILN